MAQNKTLKWARRVTTVVLIPLLAFTIYVQIVNRNSDGMTGKQKIMKAVYPLLMGWNKLTGNNRTILRSATSVSAPSSVYDISVEFNDGSVVSLGSFQGKKLLLVNTASNCGYTNQYAALEDLRKRYNHKLEIIAFPANDFKEQEKASDAEIQQFCTNVFQLGFPISKKTVVIKADQQHPVYKWLTSEKLNGWNNQAPSWNFSKYLIDERGRLTHYFDPGIDPLSKEMIQAINSK
jgi:glutathione peroxidase